MKTLLIGLTALLLVGCANDCKRQTTGMTEADRKAAQAARDRSLRRNTAADRRFYDRMRENDRYFSGRRYER